LRERTGPAWADVGVGLFVVAMAGIVMWQTLAIPTSPVYARVGPKLFPWVAGGGLAALGLLLIGIGIRGGWSDALEDRPTDPVNWRSFLLLAAGLLANLALIDTLGFVFASTLQFVLVCAAFGSTNPLRDGAIGLAVCLSAFLAFDKLLGVNIGAGLLEGIL